MVRFVDALTEPEAPELTIEKLVGVYRVFIPHFIAAYTFHRTTRADHRRADDPLLDFILQDEFDDWRDGEMMIQSLIETPEEVDRARAPGRAPEADGRSRWHPGPARSASAPRTVASAAACGQGGSCMRKYFPVEELARDERFNKITNPGPDA